MQNETEDFKENQRGDHKLLAERTELSLSPQFLETAAYDRHETKENEIDLLDYWRVLLKRKWMIIAFLFVIVIATITTTSFITPIYQASLTLQIERIQPRVLQYQSVESEDIYGFLAYQAFYKTQYELLQSHSLAQRVIDQLALTKNSSFVGENEQKVSIVRTFVDWMKEAFGKQPNDQELKKQEPNFTKLFLSALKVEPIRDSRLVKIHYESPDPELAAQIVNTLANAFIDMNLERRYEATSYARNFLQERLEQIKARLEDTERELAAYADREQIINLDKNQSISTHKLAEINSALATAEANRIAAEANYLQMKRTRGQGLSKILESRVIQELKQLKAELEAEYQEALKLYKPAYPKMRQLASRIAEVQKEINQEINNIRSAVESDYEAAQASESMLRARLKETKNEVLALQKRSIQYNILKREVDTNRQLYEGLLQRFKEVGIAGGVGVNNISIVDKADTPSSPFKPNLALNGMLAVVFGLFGGIALAFVVESTDETINQADDFEKILGMPSLGLIPEIKEARVLNKGNETIATTIQRDPRSGFAEAYRSLRTALQFSTPTGPPKILAITSSVQNEGKSTTALSLAITFAQTGKKVLLIDSDLRKPSLHRSVQIDNTCGLTHYLAGDAKPVDIAQPVLLPNLFVIPAGPLPPNPAELLSTTKMLSLLALATEKFDQVILDCPPVLGLADALILGNMAESIILVVEAHSTHRSAVQNASKRLRVARTRLLGGILTKLEVRNSSYDYYHSYYYGGDSSPKRKIVKQH